MSRRLPSGISPEQDLPFNNHSTASNSDLSLSPLPNDPLLSHDFSSFAFPSFSSSAPAVNAHNSPAFSHTASLLSLSNHPLSSPSSDTRTSPLPTTSWHSIFSSSRSSHNVDNDGNIPPLINSPQPLFGNELDLPPTSLTRGLTGSSLPAVPSGFELAFPTENAHVLSYSHPQSLGSSFSSLGFSHSPTPLPAFSSLAPIQLPSESECPSPMSISPTSFSPTDGHVQQLRVARPCDRTEGTPPDHIIYPIPWKEQNGSRKGSKSRMLITFRVTLASPSRSPASPLHPDLSAFSVDPLPPSSPTGFTFVCAVGVNNGLGSDHKAQPSQAVQLELAPVVDTDGNTLTAIVHCITKRSAWIAPAEFATKYPETIPTAFSIDGRSKEGYGIWMRNVPPGAEISFQVGLVPSSRVSQTSGVFGRQ